MATLIVYERGKEGRQGEGWGRMGRDVGKIDAGKEGKVCDGGKTERQREREREREREGEGEEEGERESMKGGESESRKRKGQ